MAKEGERKKLKKQHFPPSNRDIFFQGTTWYSLSCVCTKRGTRLKNTSKSGFLHSLEKQIQLKFDTLALQCQKETHPWCLRAASSFPVQGKVETLHEFLQTDPSGHSVPPCQSSRMDVLLAAIRFVCPFVLKTTASPLAFGAMALPAPSGTERLPPDLYPRNKF